MTIKSTNSYKIFESIYKTIRKAHTINLTSILRNQYYYKMPRRELRHKLSLLFKWVKSKK